MNKIIVLLLVCAAAPALADNCPTDRPNSRLVTVIPTSQICTLVNCATKLVCPKDGGYLRVPSHGLQFMLAACHNVYRLLD